MKPKQCSYDKEPAVAVLTFTDLASGKPEFRANLCAYCLQEMKAKLRNRQALGITGRALNQQDVLKRLLSLESEMTKQMTEILSSEKGFGSSASLCWDGRCVERRVLRWVLNLKEKPFNDADTMAGW